jgi:hypothetical protein
LISISSTVTVSSHQRPLLVSCVVCRVSCAVCRVSCVVSACPSTKPRACAYLGISGSGAWYQTGDVSVESYGAGKKGATSPQLRK